MKKINSFWYRIFFQLGLKVNSSSKFLRQLTHRSKAINSIPTAFTKLLTSSQHSKLTPSTPELYKYWQIHVLQAIRTILCSLWLDLTLITLTIRQVQFLNNLQHLRTQTKEHSIRSIRYKTRITFLPPLLLLEMWIAPNRGTYRGLAQSTVLLVSPPRIKITVINRVARSTPRWATIHSVPTPTLRFLTQIRETTSLDIHRWTAIRS